LKFRKGQSGNPGGRPKVMGDVQELARQHAPRVIVELARLALKAKSETARIAAIREGDPEVTNKLLTGYRVGDQTYKVHLDGYNLVPYLTGQATKSPRDSFFYINDDQQLTCLRYDNWKFVFLEQRAPGQLLIWANPFTNLRVPKIFNLRTDPYERADITSNTYYDWLIDHVFLLVPAQDYVGQFLATFRDFPPRQKAASFNMDEVLAKLKEAK
jgi:arylsulfatase